MDGTNFRRIASIGTSPPTRRWNSMNSTPASVRKRRLCCDSRAPQHALLRRLGRHLRARSGHDAVGDRCRSGRPSLLERWLHRLPAAAVHTGCPCGAPVKSQTYSVEADNAELRHSPAHLARRSRCFSRYLWALALGLLVCAWNQRRRFKRQLPELPAEVYDFVAGLF